MLDTQKKIYRKNYVNVQGSLRTLILISHFNKITIGSREANESLFSLKGFTR